MKIRLTLATGLALIAFSPRLCRAADNSGKKAEKEDARLERKCAHEADKDRRDEERHRRHARRDNKWDELCAVEQEPPPEEPPVILPPILPPWDGTLPPLLQPPAP